MERAQILQRSRDGEGLTVEIEQLFGNTEILLEMGMCGGPVLNKHEQCIGIVEGIVSTPNHPLQNHAAIVESQQIVEWLDQEL